MQKQFNYYWRLFATGFCFVFFGIGGFLLWVFIFPLLKLIPGKPAQKKRRAQWCVHFSFFIFNGLMHRTGVMTYEVNGLEKLNRPGQLIIANHPTLVDVVFLISQIPYADCIVKEKLWHNPFTRGAVVNAGYISNSDPEKMIAESISCLKAGGTMLVFPEGTRSKPDSVYKFQRSVAHIALSSNAIVTPVFLSCYPATLSKEESWYQIPDRRFHLAMHVGNDMVLDEFLEIKPRSIAVRRFNRFLMEYFSQLRQRYEHYGK